MDKLIKIIEAIDKKIDYRVKDRGDLKKVSDKTLKKSEGNIQMNMNLAFPECGDSVQKPSANLKPEKMKLNVGLKKPANEDSKMKYLISGTSEKEFLNKNNYDKDKLAKSHSELRKRIRDRYTIKLNGPVNKSDHVSLNRGKKEDGSNGALKTDGDNRGQSLRPPCVPAVPPQKQMSEETTQTAEKSKPSSAASTKPDHDKKREKTPTKPEKIIAQLSKEENRLAKRKPIIKTITSKTGPVRIFKAVTFVDQKHPTTPLEIKIPSHLSKRQQKISKYTETSSLKFNPKITVSKVSSSKPSVSSKQASFKQEKLTKLAAVRKRAERRRDRKFRHGRSPAGSIKELPSPPTEVARWAPASVDPQAIPYYDAWINTTLAAISKTTKQDKINYEKQAKLLMSFQKALEERPTSPELFYANCADERYTGKIKVRQTERSRKKQQIPTV